MNYFQDRWGNGGYCLNGFSPAYNSGGSMNVSIPVPNQSTERRTFLFAHRVGLAPDLTITVQGQQFTFKRTGLGANQVTPTFQSAPYGGNSGVHAIDITGVFNININTFVFNIPSQGVSPSNRYTGFTMLRSFTKAGLDTMNLKVELNEYNYQDTSPTWQINMTSPLQPISTASPVAMGLMCDYICDCQSDGTEVRVNGNPSLGTIGGNPTGFGICGGGLGAHIYYGSTFTALLNNNVNEAVGCMDCLSNIVNRVNNGDTTFALNCETASADNTTNCVWGAVVGYKDTGAPSPYECAGCVDYSVSNLQPTSATLNWNGFGGVPNPCSPQSVAYVNGVYWREVGSLVWNYTQVDAQNLQVGQTANSLDIGSPTPLTTGVLHEWMVINENNGGAICTPSTVMTFTPQ